MCNECSAAREAPERRVFDPACLWCGARYLQMLKTWPAPLTIEEPGKPTRLESPTDRQAWRSRVLAAWVKQGHDATQLKELAAAAEVPYAPVMRGRAHG